MWIAIFLLVLAPFLPLVALAAVLGLRLPQGTLFRLSGFGMIFGPYLAALGGAVGVVALLLPLGLRSKVAAAAALVVGGSCFLLCAKLMGSYWF